MTGNETLQLAAGSDPETLFQAVGAVGLLCPGGDYLTALPAEAKKYLRDLAAQHNIPASDCQNLAMVLLTRVAVAELVVLKRGYVEVTRSGPLAPEEINTRTFVALSAKSSLLYVGSGACSDSGTNIFYDPFPVDENVTTEEMSGATIKGEFGLNLPVVIRRAIRTTRQFSKIVKLYSKQKTETGTGGVDDSTVIGATLRGVRAAAILG